ncbi:Porphobilinogen deaminase [hydrothermal vent metagenome]|uniref:hydroxymethylbilane synthase n=1 Tax=hydrothermal vent metagenome TaxID=652676 RepID=A0A3B0THG0_9ZZZZ
MPVSAPTPFLTIGTRGSPLALVQANDVRRRLAGLHQVDEKEIAIKIIKTDGDRTQSENLSLRDIGGKGLFSKEIEDQLLAKSIDLAVHSAKDMATTLPNGLIMDVFLVRQDVRDAFISLTATTLGELAKGARVGTSSLRRAAQLRHRRPDLEIVEFRGNVATRLKKLGNGVAEATLLAMAGLNRLGQAQKASSLLDPLEFPPAPAQGAVGLEMRLNDQRTRDLAAPLDDRPTNQAVVGERAMLEKLDGSCRTPIGVFSRFKGDRLLVSAQILSLDGAQCFSAEASGAPKDSTKIGLEVAEKLIALAGEQFLADLKSA